MCICLFVKRLIHSQLNWTILLCDVIPDGKLSKLRSLKAISQASELSFPVVFYTENCAVHSWNPTVSSVYLPTPPCHTHKKTQRTDEKLTNLWCAREHSIQFSVQFFYTVKLHILTYRIWGPLLKYKENCYFTIMDLFSAACVWNENLKQRLQ
jgi:hypothetical protein